ncbi:MAG: RNA polymerase sporulation sigma factor SigH [Actinobacteria bacterium]|jgi:RNA polymerase sporulation-specific sigma factor|nr:RNA polymerase sporulation sigma factor SigH [Actinomycetota bacterium]
MESAAFARRTQDKPPIEPSDEELVAHAKAGDPDALRCIWTRYRQFVRLKANSYFLAGGDGDDLIQEGNIGLYKAIRDYEYGRSTTFRSFAELCVTRQIITAIKTASRQKHVPLNTYVSFSHSPSGADFDNRTLADIIPSGRTSDPVQQVISSEECASLTDCLLRLLSPLESRVLKYYLEGNSYEAIAAEIGHDTKTVDNALQRIKRKVTLHLESRRVVL